MKQYKTNHIVFYIFSILSIFTFSLSLFGQDEVYYRDLLKGDNETQIKRRNDYKFLARGKSYHLDITGDGVHEVITPVKKDGSDWLEIANPSKQILFESKLQAYGLNASLYKIQVLKLGKGVKVLLLYYLEGTHNYLELHRSARVYLVTYEKGRFSYNAYPAAHFAIEKLQIKNQYWRRLMQVNVVDLNRDNIKEVVISYLTSQHIFNYLGAGNWKRY